MSSRLLTGTWSTFQPSLQLPDLEANLSVGTAVAEAFVGARLFDADEWAPCRNMEVADFFDELDLRAQEADDTFIVYLCSHGLFPAQAPFRLATSRTMWKDEVSRAVVVAQVLAAIGRSPATNKALIVDACFAGQAASSLVEGIFGAMSMPDGQPPSCTIIASVSPVDLAAVDTDDWFPVFTKQLVESLAQLRKNASGKINLSMLHESVSARIKDLEGTPPPQLYDVNGGASRLLSRRGSGDVSRIRTNRPEPVVSVLFADDQLQWHEQFRQIEEPGVVVHYATDTDAARRLLDSCYFDILVLDLMFDGVPATDLFKEAAALPYEPDVFLATRLGQGEYAWEALDRVLSYPSPVDALVFKHKPEFIVETQELARDLLQQRRRVLDRVQGSPAAAAQVASRVTRRTGPDAPDLADEVATLEAEVLALIHDVVGPWLDDNDDDPYVDGFAIAPLGGGRSSCSVFSVKSVISEFSFPPVSQLVLKIGPREEIEEEVQRYERYVQVGIPLSIRTDKIKQSYGCRLGAVLYSFLGDDGSDVDELGDSPLDAIVAGIKSILSPDQRRWYASVSTKKVGFLSYFAETNFDYQAFRRTIQQANEQLTEIKYVPREGYALLDASLLDASAVCGLTDAVLVHGDMHLGNIVRYADGRCGLIDYRNVGPGPRLIDFSTLEIDCWLRGDTPELPRAELIDAYLTMWTVMHEVEGRMPKTPTLDDLPGVLIDCEPLIADLPEFCRPRILPIALCRRAAFANFGNVPKVEYAAQMWLSSLRRWSFKSAWVTASERRAVRAAPLAIALGAQRTLQSLRESE